MAREGDEDADVVQQGRIVQQLAGQVAGVVQAHGLGAVEQVQGQARHMAGVAFLEAAAPRQVQHALLAHGMEAAVGMGHAGGQVIHQDAVLQVAVADAHAVEALVLHDGLEDSRTGHDDVGTVGVDAGHAAAFLEGTAAEFLDGPSQAAVAEHVAGFLRGPARARGVLGVQGGGDLGQVLGRTGAGHGFFDDEVRYALERAQGIVADIVLQGGVACRVVFGLQYSRPLLQPQRLLGRTVCQ